MKKVKKKISLGMLLGLMALTINIITVSVFIYQTNLMQTQQHASVWPYLEWTMVYNQIDGFRLNVKNNGIGPALVKDVKLKLQGKEVSHLDSVYTKTLGTLRFPHLTSSIDNRVIPPGESIQLVRINSIEWSFKFNDQLKQQDFEMEICYESIYKEQWTCLGLEVIEGNCY